MLIVLSFNDSKSRVVWGGFTTRWYSEVFSNSTILSAFATTIALALLSALIASVIGTLAALGIDRMRRKQYQVVMFFTNIPLLNADIVTGIALMLWFVRFYPSGLQACCSRM